MIRMDSSDKLNKENTLGLLLWVIERPQECFIQ